MNRWSELQLAFGGEFDEGQMVDDGGRVLTDAEVKAISEAARVAFVEGEDKPRWWSEYVKLIEYGWPWRVACYMAWASSPKVGRWPETLERLSVDVLGLTSPRVIYTWRQKYPSINQVVAMMQAAPLWEHRREVIDALVAVATSPDYKGFNDRKLFLELTGDYVPRSVQQTLVGQSQRDLTELSDAELDALLGNEKSLTTDFTEKTDEEEGE